MRNSGLAFVFTISLFLLPACKNSEKAATADKGGKDPSVLTFDNGEKVTKSEFEYVYQKNNGGWDNAKTHTSAQFREYLDLYIKFKRKVMAAEALKLHESQSFINEFEGYRKQLAQPYLVEKKVQEDLVTEAYERSKYFVSASHILIRTEPESAPADTAKAYAKVRLIRDSIANQKMDFGAMARRHSEDPSAKKNDGNLGFFTVFDMVYPFESGAFNTPVGSVSQPIRSAYGYHLIKVQDKVPSSGKKSAAHIIVRIGPQYSAKDTAMALARINEIYGKLKAGGDFTSLAKDFSDDGTTSAQGGSLGSGRLIQKMEEIKLKLAAGEYSEPFDTDYGWHILKVTSSEPIKSFDESKGEIKTRVARDARSYLSREILIKRVKQEGNYSENQETLTKLAATFRDQDVSALGKALWRPNDSLIGDLYPAAVCQIGEGDGKRTGTVRDLVDFYQKDRKALDGVTIEELIRQWMKRYSEQAILDYEESQLPDKYPEYKALVKEYRDGILLFTLTEEKVWRKAVEDTVGLLEYYNSHPDSFTAAERVIATEYSATSNTHIDSALAMIATGKSESEIESAINKGSALNIRIRTLAFERGKKEGDVDLYDKKAGYMTPKMKQESGWRVLVVKENLPAGRKSFQEARPECITLYQNHLENTWNEELRVSYPVKINEATFDSLYK